MLVKLASLGVVECAWAQGSGFPWNWYVYTPYPERSQEEFSTNITIGRVCANKTDGSLEMQFDKSVEPMDPEVKERFMQMFYKKFPDWSKPNITRVWAMEEKEAEARKLDEYLQELSKKNCAEAAAQVTASQIRCPVCRSTAVRKIDGLEHVAFYEWLGIASPLIGKCYECKSCGHFW